jgi:hypothetical protein
MLRVSLSLFFYLIYFFLFIYLDQKDSKHEKRANPAQAKDSNT